MRHPDLIDPPARTAPGPREFVTAGVLWSAVLFLAILGPSRAQLLPSLAAYSVAFVALLRLWRRSPWFLDDPRVLLGGALILRLTLFPALPDLSDDLYRYVWDGWLSISGVNPFRFLPSAPELEAFQGTDLFRALNSPDYHSIYPPLSQIVFLAGGAAYGWAGWPAAAYAVKAVFMLLEGIGVLFLFMAARAVGVRVGAVALYAWNPLVLVTLTAGGHTESGLVLGLGMMAYGVAAQRFALSWVGLVLATATKGIPILLAPVLLRRQWTEVGWRKALRAPLPALILGLGLLAPFYYFSGIVSALASSADLYVRLFEFNAGPYFLIKEAGLWITGADWGKTIGPVLRAAFLVGTGIIWLKWPIREGPGLLQASLAILGLYLLSATTVHPWYIVWGLALVPLTSFLRSAWLWASWAAFLTYFVYLGAPQGAPTTVFWGGVAFFLVVEREGSIRDCLLRWAGRRKARQIAPHLRGELVLDLGAGEGYVATGLGAAGRRVLLTDVGRFFRVELPGVVYDGRNLPFPDGGADTVLISLALHHAEDPDRVVSEALRVARQRVVITESTYRWEWERKTLEILDRWANRTRGMAESERAEETLKLRTVDQWESAFAHEGAEVVRSERINLVGHRHHLFILERRGDGERPRQDQTPER